MQSVPAGRVVIDYWEKWTGLEGAAIAAVVNRFNASQSRVWVRLTSVAEIKSKAMVAIAGGDPPDLVGVYSYNVPQYAESGAVWSIDELEREFGPRAARAASAPVAAGDRAIDPDAYAPAVLRLLSHEGRQWAGVASLYNLALYYNRALFKESGLDPDRPPRTVDELDEFAAKLERLERDDRGEHTIVRAGFLPNLPEWWPYFWPIMFGGTLYDQARNRALLTEPASLAAYSWVQSTARRVGVKQGSAFSAAFSRSMHSPQDPFISGKAAMIVIGPWIANFIKAYNPGLDYAAVPVPVGGGVAVNSAQPLGMLEADVVMIPRAARHPREAFEFLAWLQSQPAQEMLATAHGKGSPLRHKSEKFVSAHPNRSVSVHDAITASPRVCILPQTREWQAFADLTLGMFDAVWRGADVRTTLTEVESRAQAMLDRAADLRARRRAHGSSGA